MKTIFFLSALLVINLSFSTAQTEEEIVKQIRQQFKTINDEIKTYTSKSDVSTDEQSGAEITVTSYVNGSKLMKIEQKSLGDMVGGTNQYYFWNNQLFFVYSTETYYSSEEGTTQSTTNENRFYFSKNKLIRWLDSEKKQKDKNSTDYKNKEKEWLEEAGKFLLEYKK